ncbi:hypothetical protein VFPPC_17549 [Pochonia chlamydosporia 170]|uniref:Uncharacterized protein n=1 Tax=Pochonia chlamydosporia 170 TaxID=1380566 RepID=A0A219AR75_METCM|nr:hypothetical protein VFPPC_17549 [Pochonia chlamydosporia 170]OWT43288.1 hypothetical protein VFPPC_17549 [Pochonia chlamydosporia 170]
MAKHQMDQHLGDHDIGYPPPPSGQYFPTTSNNSPNPPSTVRILRSKRFFGNMPRKRAPFLITPPSAARFDSSSKAQSSIYLPSQSRARFKPEHERLKQHATMVSAMPATTQKVSILTFHKLVAGLAGMLPSRALVESVPYGWRSIKAQQKPLIINKCTPLDKWTRR